jgi:hypothetical protein
MGTRGRKPLEIRRNCTEGMIKRNYYIDKTIIRGLTVLSALTGKELSALVNEALEDLLNKYQPQTDISLLDTKEIL